MLLPNGGLNDILTPEAIEAARVKTEEMQQSQNAPLGSTVPYGTGSPSTPPGSPGTLTTASPSEQESNQSNPPSYAGVDDYQQQNDIEPEDDGQDYEREPPIDWDNLYAYDSQGKSTGKLTPKDLDDLAEEYMSLIRLGVDARKDGKRDDWIDAWRDVYEQKEPLGPSPWPNSCRLRPPDVSAAVETLAARWRESVFSGDSWIKVTPEIPTDSDTALKWEAFFMSEMSPSNEKLESRYAKALLDAAVDGSKVVQAWWCTKKRKVRKRVTVNQNLISKLRGDGHKVDAAEPGNETAFPNVTIKGTGNKTIRTKFGAPHLLEREEVVANHFSLKFHNIQDYFMYPASSESVEESGIAGVFDGLTMQMIKQGANDGYFDEDQVKKLDEGSPIAMGDYGDDIQAGTLGGLQRTDRTQGVDREPVGGVGRKYAQFRIACFAAWYDVDNNGDDERIWVVMETSTKTILAFGRLQSHNGEIPINVLNPDPAIGGGFYGYSQIEKAYELHLENSAIRRMAIDLATLASITYVTMERGSRNKPSDMQVKPGPNFVDTDEDGDIKAVHQIQPVSNSTMPERQQIAMDIQRILASDDTSQGVSSGDESPVAVANMRMTGSAIRMRMKLIHILDNMTWIAQQFFDYNQQYMEESKNFAIRRNGKVIEGSISLADLSIPCRVEAYCKDLTADAALRQQFAEKIFTALAQSPFAQADIQRLWTVLSDYVKSMGFDEDLVPRMGSYENAEQMQQAAAAQQQAQQALQQQGALQGNVPGGTNGQGQPGQAQAGNGPASPQAAQPAPQGQPGGTEPIQPIHQLLAHAIDTIGQRPSGQNGH